MRSRNVHLFIFDSVADWELSIAAAAINNPRYPQHSDPYHVITVAPDRRPITTMSGFRIIPDSTLSEVDAEDSAMLMLPGGALWERGCNSDVIHLARTFFIEGVPIAAIGGATRALAAAGLLDDFHHTGDTREFLASTGYRGAKFYLDAPAVTDENVITAAGTAPLEFAREIVHALNLVNAPSLDAWSPRLKFNDAARSFEIPRCVAG